MKFYTFDNCTINISFPVEYDIDYDIKGISTLYREYLHLDIQTLDKIIAYLEKEHKIGIVDLLNRRVELVNKLRRTVEYLRDRGEEI